VSRDGSRLFPISTENCRNGNGGLSLCLLLVRRTPTHMCLRNFITSAAAAEMSGSRYSKGVWCIIKRMWETIQGRYFVLQIPQ